MYISLLYSIYQFSIQQNYKAKISIKTPSFLKDIDKKIQCFLQWPTSIPKVPRIYLIKGLQSKV